MQNLTVNKWHLNISNSKLTVGWFIVFSWFFHSYLAAQSDSIFVKAGVQQVCIDPFSNAYLLTKNHELKKYNDKGEFELSYSDLQLSELSKIASDHPFKCMIYYPEYDIIRVLGNKLQVIAELNLSRFGFGEITAVAPSTGYQSFWIFDATDQQLVKINQQYEVELKSNDLTRFTKSAFFPTLIKEREGWLYAYDPKNGLYIFDNFGTYSTKIDIKGGTNFSVFNGKIFVSTTDGLLEIDPVLKSITPLPLKIGGTVMELSFRKMIVEQNGYLKLVKF
ncbi:MAG: hypothetical protein R2730_15805 [Chitinophagales bacterium]